MSGKERYLRRRGKHISVEERFYIETELRKGTSISEIARSIDRPRETIQREKKKGLVVQRDTYLKEHTAYFADAAQRITEFRQSKKGAQLKIGNDYKMAAAIEDLILDFGYSPDAALMELEANGWSKLPCTKTVYNYVHNEVLTITIRDLPMKGKQRRAASKKYRHAHRNIKGKSIELRPKEVKKREVFGHWEGDLIVGAQGTKSVILTMVERKTRKLITAKFSSREKYHVIDFIDLLEVRFGKRFSGVFKSITWDNGSEFADFEAMERSRYKSRSQSSRTEVFYAHPYCSSERGTNEVTNRFLRRRIPKSCNIGLISDKQIQEVTKWINNYPRRILKKYGYLNSEEAFECELAKLDVAS